MAILVVLRLKSARSCGAVPIDIGEMKPALAIFEDGNCGGETEDRYTSWYEAETETATQALTTGIIRWVKDECR